VGRGSCEWDRVGRGLWEALPCVDFQAHGKHLFAVRFLIERTPNNFFNKFIKFIKISNKFEKIKINGN
jgi:hypothetical protein